MLSAQLSHKVPTEFEGMEDVLTSSVFALLRYLPAHLACHLLSRWAKIPVQQGQPEVDFWPRYPTPAGFGVFLDLAEQEEPLGRGDTEPDVVIRTPEWLVLVEVKYQSHLDHDYDQLGREFAIGYRQANREGLDFRLLVLTANALEPRPAGIELKTGVQQALSKVLEMDGDVIEGMISSVPDALRWINWQRVYRSLSQTSAVPYIAEHNRRLLEDTCQLLGMRGLKPYSSRPLLEAMKRWDRADIADEAWRLPMSYRYATRSSSHLPAPARVG